MTKQFAMPRYDPGHDDFCVQPPLAVSSSHKSFVPIPLVRNPNPQKDLEFIVNEIPAAFEGKFVLIC
jgi:hypothetical protein